MALWMWDDPAYFPWERLPLEETRDDHAGKPDDTLLPLEEWNAKVDAMITEWVARQAKGF